jgi:hypothetical protein
MKIKGAVYFEGRTVMKPQGIVLAMLLLLTMFACDEEAKLGPALSDVRSAAPTVCKDFCAWAQGCAWNAFGFEATGVELPAAQQDWQNSCLVACANRAHKGSFFIEIEWQGGEEPPIYTFSEAIDGKPWTAYFECLWDNEFWDCDEHGNPELQYHTEQACSAYDGCIQILDGAMQYNWNPDGNGGEGSCDHQGFDYLWDGYTVIW